VYVVSGGPDPDEDIRYVGSAHASHGRERIDLLIATMRGGEVPHSDRPLVRGPMDAQIGERPP
jgi:hypothetical protein